MVGERDEPASAPGAFDATIGGPEDRLALLASTLRPAGETSGDEDDDGSEEAPELARGDLVGRYVVLSRIGTGGMGVVYAAYDPDLDRKVAVKLLLRRCPGDAGRIRLMREAQAMARLAHPNVVTVYDTGTLGERVWLAMEFIRGQTLSHWLKLRPRPWREVLAVFLRAGEGLQAAHSAGLVHRDFKPDNVMISEDGRVRVMDFGLARSQRSPGKELASHVSGVRGLAALRAALTTDGAVVGTPQYMAAEQWQGAATDARSDQFSYCVALWEALHGAPPFAATTVHELVTVVLAGKITPPVRGDAPGWLQRALVRGLDVAPARRWPEMTALLAALARGQTRQRQQRWLVGLGLAALAVAGVVVGQRHERAQRLAHAELQEQVRGARSHASTLVGHVLSVRLGLLADYDPVVLELRRFVAYEAGLLARAEAAGGPRLPEIRERLAERGAAAANTVALVERFKTLQAIVRNSSQRFPVLVAELTAAAPDLDKRLLALLRELLRFDNAPREELAHEIRGTLAALVDTPTAEPLPRELALLRRHAELILASRPAVDQIVAELLDLQADRRYEPLAALIEANDAATIGLDDVSLWTLLLAACGAIGGAGAWLLVLRRAARRDTPPSTAQRR